MLAMAAFQSMLNHIGVYTFLEVISVKLNLPQSSWPTVKDFADTTELDEVWDAGKIGLRAREKAREIDHYIQSASNGIWTGLACI